MRVFKQFHGTIIGKGGNTLRKVREGVGKRGREGGSKGECEESEEGREGGREGGSKGE